MTDIEKKAREYAFAHNSNPNPPYCTEGELNRRLTDSFLAGAAYALSNQWRDAEKEKPEDGVIVLVHNTKYGIWQAKWCEYMEYWECPIENDFLYPAKDVDAWLPLPEYKPKGE